MPSLHTSVCQSVARFDRISVCLFCTLAASQHTYDLIVCHVCIVFSSSIGMPFRLESARAQWVSLAEINSHTYTPVSWFWWVGNCCCWQNTRKMRYTYFWLWNIAWHKHTRPNRRINSFIFTEKMKFEASKHTHTLGHHPLPLNLFASFSLSLSLDHRSHCVFLFLTLWEDLRRYPPHSPLSYLFIVE